MIDNNQNTHLKRIEDLDSLSSEKKLNFLKDKIRMLEILKQDIQEAQLKIEGYQDDDNLINLLKQEYPKLNAGERKKVLSIVEGKKPLNKVSDKEKNEILFSIKGECYKCFIDPYKNGEPLTFKQLKSKINREMKQFKKEFEKESILNLFAPKNKQ